MSQTTGMPIGVGVSDAEPMFKRLLRQRSFVIAAGILLGAALLFNFNSRDWHFKKLPVDIKTYGKPLRTLPMQIGSWRAVLQDERLQDDVEHALGTEEYIFRDYVNEKVVLPSRLDRIQSLPDAQAKAEIGMIRRSSPEAVVTLSLTYYTGLVDTVAHIPDRCYVADGYEPTDAREVTWQTGDSPTQARYVTFEDVAAGGKMIKNVGYFFEVNGAEECDPITGVRKRLQNLTEKYGYYGKIELLTVNLDPLVSETVMKNFLTAAKPEIKKCFPDWQKVLAHDAAEAKK